MHTHVFHDHRRGLGELALVRKQDDGGRVTLRLFDKALMIVCGLIPWPEIIPTRWIVTVAQKIKHRLVRKRQDRVRRGNKVLDLSDELGNRVWLRDEDSPARQRQPVRAMCDIRQ